MNDFVYMYGMVMSTVGFLLNGQFPKADGTANIRKKHHQLGGETGTAAAVLCSLGVNVKLGGSHLGRLNRDLILNYFADKCADVSELKHEDFDGIIDWVFIDSQSRTCFGEWDKLFSRSEPFYEPPCESSVRECKCIGADPFFGEDIARLAVKHGKPYAVIDCEHDSFFNKHCAVNAVSHQYLDDHYSSMSYDDAYSLYTDNSDGLVIFTLGEKGAMYGRRGQAPKYCEAFEVNAVSTLGAGDTFKAGTIYALYKGMSDDELVRFSCATAASACMYFPIADNPPTIDRINKLILK
ncbi:MAG: PfkB family carbohydrate kinase [Ruminococcus sp.]|nr:PfkB family carbohydrate kinase [Ruminococcus sp.]